MRPLEFDLLVFVVSILAGVIGSILGLGGGIIVIPALTLVFHIDIRYAIGASIVAVIATSSGAAAAYVRDGLANLRVAMVLELATTTGALSGAFLAGLISARSVRKHRSNLLHYVGANGVEGFRQKTPQNAVEVLEILFRRRAVGAGGGCG